LEKRGERAMVQGFLRVNWEFSLSTGRGRNSEKNKSKFDAITKTRRLIKLGEASTKTHQTDKLQRTIIDS
jgi:hypothetical protein